MSLAQGKQEAQGISLIACTASSPTPRPRLLFVEGMEPNPLCESPLAGGRVTWKGAKEPLAVQGEEQASRPGFWLEAQTPPATAGPELPVFDLGRYLSAEDRSAPELQRLCRSMAECLRATSALVVRGELLASSRE